MTEIKTAAVLKHINLRKEGPEDAKEPAFDLKLTATVTAELVDDLALNDDEEAGKILAAFWTEDGHVAIPSLDRISFNRTIMHCHVTIDDCMELLACKAKSFSFLPQHDKRAELQFTISATGFNPGYIALLSERLQEPVSLHLLCQQGDLFNSDDKQEGATCAE